MVKFLIFIYLYVNYNIYNIYLNYIFHMFYSGSISMMLVILEVFNYVFFLFPVEEYGHTARISLGYCIRNLTQLES